MNVTLRFHTAMLAAGYRLAAAGKINRDQLAAVVACCKDSNCDTCQQCEQIALMAGQDSGDITADQAANPKAINWQGLLAFVEALMAILMPLINPPKPSPSLPAGAGS